MFLLGIYSSMFDCICLALDPNYIYYVIVINEIFWCIDQAV